MGGRPTIAAVLLALVTGHAASCSSGGHSGDPDASTAGTDADADSDTETDSDTTSGTGTDTAPGGWHWEWEDPPWDLSCGFLYDVTGRDSGDVVAVGYMLLSYQNYRYILRFDGSAWHMDPYEDIDGPPQSFGLGVACLSGDDHYYLTTSCPFNLDLLILASAADAWAAVPEPGLCSPDYSVPTLADFNDYLGCLENGFAVLFSCPWQGDDTYLAAHDGVEWTVVLGPESLSDAGIHPYIVWGPAVDDLSLFVANDPATPGYHFDGASLTPMTAPAWPQSDDHPGSVHALDGAAEHGYGYYAVGVGIPEGGIENKGFVWRSEDAIDWIEVEVPHPPDPETYREYFEDVWISDQGQVYVVGFRNYLDLLPYHTFPVLLRFDGEGWEEIDVPDPPESPSGEAQLYGVWGTGSEVFAVGNCANCYGQSLAPVILHYDPD